MGLDLAVMKAETAVFETELAVLRAEADADTSFEDLSDLRVGRYNATFELIDALRRRRKAAKG